MNVVVEICVGYSLSGVCCSRLVLKLALMGAIIYDYSLLPLVVCA